MGKSHYEDLFNYLSNSKDVNTICKNAEYQKDVEEIIHAIKDLKDNKSCGLDGISAEHLKHCSDVIIPLLSMCFTSLFVHGIVTESLISVVLVPKNKTKLLAYVARVITDLLLWSISKKLLKIYVTKRMRQETSLICGDNVQC